MPLKVAKDIFQLQKKMQSSDVHKCIKLWASLDSRRGFFESSTKTGGIFLKCKNIRLKIYTGVETLHVLGLQRMLSLKLKISLEVVKSKNHPIWSINVPERCPLFQVANESNAIKLKFGLALQQIIDVVRTSTSN